MKITVFVTPKKNVLDPQGAAISHAMTSHGFKDLRGVRMGKMIELEIDGELDDELRRSIDTVCRDLLSNPVIEDYSWTNEL